MVKFVVVGKFGEAKTLTVGNLNVNELYKKCKFRKKDYFSKRHTWKVNRNEQCIYIHIYAKDSGRPATINKFELPPPVDKDLFYGTLGIIATSDKEGNNLVDLTHKEWDKIYTALMGGFEDLDSNEEERSSDEYIPPELKTKQGYSKENNFIVEDGDELEFLSSSEDPSEDEYEFDEDDETPSDTEGEGCLSEEVKSNNDETEPEEEEEEEEEDDNEDEDNENDGDDEFEQGDSELTEEEYVKEN